MYRFLVILTIASTTGLQTWRTIFNNFAVEVVHLNGSHVGAIQSIREIPGFLALLAVYLFMVMKEHRVSSLSILTLGLGVGLTGFFPTFGGLIATTLIMSFGFHYYETTNQSLSLQYFDKDQSPWIIGKMRSYAAATNIVVGAVIFVLSYFLNYKTILALVGALIFIVAGWSFFQNPHREDLPVQHKKMVFRRKYWLYYTLTFIAGARRQIFVAFAIFLLVKIFDFSIQEISILFVINNLVNYLVNPLIGKAIIRFGERWILSMEYLSLIFIFTAYGTVHAKYIVALLYILDNFFFNFGIGIRTYFQKIGDPKDVAPTMAVGFTINHIAAVVIPVLGGLTWIVDYRIPFFFGTVLSIVSLIMVQFVKTPAPIPVEESEL